MLLFIEFHSLQGTSNGDDRDGEGDDVVDLIADPSASDYDYLLKMPMWNLTMEKVKCGFDIVPWLY